MKAKLTLIAAAMAISGFAFAQGAGTDATQGAAGDATGGGMAGPAPSFSQLDKNGDGKIEYSEAQTDPTLAKYWQDHNLSKDHTMDQSEFSQFETSISAPPSEQAPAGQPSPGMSQ